MADWQNDIDKLLAEKNSDKQAELIKKIAKAKPYWQEVVEYLEKVSFSPVEKKGIILRSAKCIDSIERPYVLYIPPAYNPQEAAPLFVYLHGGVSRGNIADNPIDYAKENPFLKLAKQNKWLMVFPMGQAGATWWDKVGMANIKNIVRTIKSEFNIDDDRVWMGGFSDGASASFLHAMVAPSDYAAFIALNGHMGVGSEDGGLPTYAPNFYNTPLYAVTTDKDGLYPTHTMRPTIDMAIDAGGKVLYRELEGTHSFSYADKEFPLIANFLKRHPRNPFPTSIVWETALREFGLCRWFAIDKVAISQPAPWHIDYNAAMIDSTITIGFIPSDFEDTIGVKIDRVVDGDYLASRIGLQAGDIIIRGNKMSIETMADLVAFKAGLSRGDFVEITVSRDNQEVPLHGYLPEPKNYNLFIREQPSAMAKVQFASNRIDITQSRLGAFRVLIHPDMMRLDQNLVIKVNDKDVYNNKVEPDIGYILKNFLKNRDRKLLYINEVKIEL
ncbi:MAG: hypothetical protein J7K40_11145 [candidate division Zixibacteria bacterium]|nr:hypothetical protein [candidate division Zixibacteria bacterium]